VRRGFRNGYHLRAAWFRGPLLANFRLSADLDGRNWPHSGNATYRAVGDRWTLPREQRACIVGLPVFLCALWQRLITYLDHSELVRWTPAHKNVIRRLWWSANRGRIAEIHSKPTIDLGLWTVHGRVDQLASAPESPDNPSSGPTSLNDPQYGAPMFMCVPVLAAPHLQETFARPESLQNSFRPTGQIPGIGSL
jgi:hypothetical protein